MATSLPQQKKLISISGAAEFLGVSIDTIRRWDKAGVLHSERPDGKNRYFCLDELEQYKLAQPLSISDVAIKLGISVTTLRRLESRGLINPKRNNAGERVYDVELINKFLSNGYTRHKKQSEVSIRDETVREEQKQVEAKILGIPIADADSIPRPKKRINEYITVSVLLFVVLLALGLRSVWISEFSVQASAPEVISSQVLAVSKQEEPEIATAPVIEATTGAIPVPLPKPEPEIATAPVIEATTGAIPIKIVTVKIEGGYGVVNIRENASIESKLIGQAKNGELFELVGLAAGWYEVKLINGSTGFIAAEYINE